jgi:hypothetical protein
VAERDVAEGYAERMLSPFSETLRSADDDRPQQLVNALADAFESVPEPLLRLVEQGGYQFYAMREGERYHDVSFARWRDVQDLLGPGGDIDLLNYQDANIAGLTAPPERTVYLRSTEPYVVVHELGHAVDSLLGVDRYGNSILDKLIVEAYFQEQTTGYSGQDPEEFWSETLRLHFGLPSDRLDPPGIPDVATWVRERAPVMTTYIDNLVESLEIVFDQDQQAFVNDPNNAQSDVIARTVLSTVTGVAPGEIGEEDMRWGREILQQQREIIVDHLKAQRAGLEEPPKPLEVPTLDVLVPGDGFASVRRLEDLRPEESVKFSVTARNQDGSRIFGLDGATLIDAPAEAFARPPQEGTRFAFDPANGVETLEPLQAQLEL